MQIYVDDIIFGVTQDSLCEEFVVTMKGEFEMSMMGELSFFLGLQVKQTKDGIFLCQSKYCKEILKKFEMELQRSKHSYAIKLLHGCRCCWKRSRSNQIQRIDWLFAISNNE